MMRAVTVKESISIWCKEIYIFVLTIYSIIGKVLESRKYSFFRKLSTQSIPSTVGKAIIPETFLEVYYRLFNSVITYQVSYQDGTGAGPFIELDSGVSDRISSRAL